MKKAGFSIVLLPLLLIVVLNSPALAQDITIGGQSVETHVVNIVNNGSVASHVETTVNGKTDVQDYNQPGELDVKNVNGDVTVTRIPNPSVSPIKIATVSPTIKPLPHKISFVSNLFEKIRNLFSRIFHNL